MLVTSVRPAFKSHFGIQLQLQLWIVIIFKLMSYKKSKFLLLFSILSAGLLLFGQNCARVEFSPSFQGLAKSEANSGNGQSYDGKLTFIATEAGFTCEDKLAPKSILRRDEHKLWTFTENKKKMCGPGQAACIGCRIL